MDGAEEGQASQGPGKPGGSNRRSRWGGLRDKKGAGGSERREGRKGPWRCRSSELSLACILE